MSIPKKPSAPASSRNPYSHYPGYISDAGSIWNSSRQKEVPLTEAGDYDASAERWKSLETAPDNSTLRVPSTTHYPAAGHKALRPANAQSGQYTANLDSVLQDTLTVPGKEDRSKNTARYLSQHIGNARRENLRQAGYDTQGLFRNAKNLTLPVTLGSNKRFRGYAPNRESYTESFKHHSPNLKKFINTGTVPVTIDAKHSPVHGPHFMSGQNPKVNIQDFVLPEGLSNEDELYLKHYNDYPLNSQVSHGLPADQQTLQHELIHANHNSVAIPEVYTSDGRKDALAGAFGIDPEDAPNYTHYSTHEFLRSLRTAKEAYARHLLNTTNMSGEQIAKTVQDPKSFRSFLNDVYGESDVDNPDKMYIPSTTAQDRNEQEVFRAFKGLKPAYQRMLDGSPKDYPTPSPAELFKPMRLAPDPRRIYDKKTINSIFDTIYPQVNNTTSQDRGINKMAALSPDKGISNEGFNKQASPLMSLITHAAPIYAAAKALPALKYGWYGLKHGWKGMEHGGKLNRQLKNTFSQGINWAARGSELLPNYLGNSLLRPAVLQARMLATNAPAPIRKAINKAVTLRAAGANKLRSVDPHAYNPNRAVTQSLTNLITDQIPGAELVRALFTRRFRNPADTSGYTLEMNNALRRLGSPDTRI